MVKKLLLSVLAFGAMTSVASSVALAEPEQSTAAGPVELSEAQMDNVAAGILDNNFASVLNIAAAQSDNNSAAVGLCIACFAGSSATGAAAALNATTVTQF